MRKKENKNITTQSLTKQNRNEPNRASRHTKDAKTLTHTHTSNNNNNVLAALCHA